MGSGSCPTGQGWLSDAGSTPTPQQGTQWALSQHCFPLPGPHAHQRMTMGLGNLKELNSKIKQNTLFSTASF